MIQLDRPTREESDRWFALSTDRQAEDRAWVNGTDSKDIVVVPVTVMLQDTRQVSTS